MFLLTLLPLKTLQNFWLKWVEIAQWTRNEYLNQTEKKVWKKRFQWSNSQTWKFKFCFCRECLDRVSTRPGNSRSLGNDQKFFPGLKYVLEYEIRGVLSWKCPEILCRYCVSVQTLPISWCNNSCMCLFPTFLPLI